MNILKDTLKHMIEYGDTLDDIAYVGSDNIKLSVVQFEQLLDTDVKSMFDDPIPPDLIIITNNYHYCRIEDIKTGGYYWDITARHMPKGRAVDIDKDLRFRCKVGSWGYVHLDRQLGVKL